MQPLALTDIAEAIHARAIGPLAGLATGVCTDTRQGAHGAVFFALRGENADGHRFVKAAIEGGAAAVVVERELPEVGGVQLVVPDALAALGDLARFYRRRFSLPIVGVTGSVGKTSTREMIAAALRARFLTHTNERNFNNEIGVPLTLLALASEHQAAVLEMAMRGPGQIADLARIAEPSIGVITNIGLSHVELLGSRANIAGAKGELLDSLPADGVAVLNADDDYADALKSRAGCRVVTYGTAEAADYRATDVRVSETGAPRFRLNGEPVAIQAPGVHHVVNAAAAAAVADILGIPLREVAEALGRFAAPAMRMETVEAPRGVTVVNDTYNAAPDSMRAALETLAVMAGEGRRSVAVLGDMKELGDFSRQAHAYVGEVAATRNVGLVIAVGTDAAEIAAASEKALGASRVARFATTEAAVAGIADIVEPGDVVLVKGSRAMGMERIVAALAGDTGAAAHP